MSMLSYVGKQIDRIFEKAVKEGNTIKGYLLAFASGFIDGLMTFWALFGLMYMIRMPINFLLSKPKKVK